MFHYNSSHKIITGIIIILWAAFHFTARDSDAARYDNGQIKYSGSVVNDLNHGRWTWYYENGKRRMEGQFDRGKRQGIWTTWGSDGTKLTEGMYVNDRLNGEYTQWNAEGKEVSRIHYVNDVPVDKDTIAVPRRP